MSQPATCHSDYIILYGIESFGFWTPTSLAVLKTIASKAMTNSGSRLIYLKNKIYTYIIFTTILFVTLWRVLAYYISQTTVKCLPKGIKECLRVHLCWATSGGSNFLHLVSIAFCHPYIPFSKKLIFYF